VEILYVVTVNGQSDISCSAYAAPLLHVSPK